MINFLTNKRRIKLGLKIISKVILKLFMMTKLYIFRKY